MLLTRVQSLKRLPSARAQVPPFSVPPSPETLSTSWHPSVFFFFIYVGGMRGALLLTLIAALTYFAAVAFLHLALMCFDDIPATASCAEVAPLYRVSFTLVHTYEGRLISP